MNKLVNRSISNGDFGKKSVGKRGDFLTMISFDDVKRGNIDVGDLGEFQLRLLRPLARKMGYVKMFNDINREIERLNKIYNGVVTTHIVSLPEAISNQSAVIQPR